MDSERVELLERYLDDTISAPEIDRLLELLRGDEAFRKELVQALRMRGLLAAGIGPDPSCERLAEVVQIAIPSGRALDAAVLEKIRERGLKPARRAAKWARVAAVVAAGWAVAIGVWIVLHDPPPVRITAASADVRVERRGESFVARPGVALHAGDLVRVPERGWASIRYEDASTLDLGSEAALLLESREIEPKRVRLTRGVLSADVAPQPAGRPMILASPHAETKVLGTRFRLSVALETTRLVMHHGTAAFANVEVTTGQAATAAEGKPPVVESVTRDVLRRLGRDHFMLGAMSGLGETWIDDTRAQGCRWDLRYQHLTPDWTRWNPKAGFPTLYLDESSRLGTVGVFTYYALMRKREPENAAVMKQYFADLKTFMQKAGEHGKVCILHVEPGVWAAIENVKVAVTSAGLPELEGLDDSAASFGKAFGVLRDRYAPNVLLAWHATKVEGVPSQATAEAVLRSGTWDLIFTDVGDRDAAFKEARGIAGSWWKEKDFQDFRAWGADLHARTGLPLMVWRIPLGNTRMAACNNTPWHFMDNRAEHWLEDYPSNRRVAEWSEAGFIGLLFGGGAIECTVHKDNAKDGATNPAPIPGNQGETSAFPDDDGGYLRLRAGKYYKAGPHRIPGN